MTTAYAVPTHHAAPVAAALADFEAATREHGPSDEWGWRPKGPNRKQKSDAEALLAHVEARTDGCWEWTGCRQPNGYGKVGRFGRTVLAHRLAYEVSRGPIPEGFTIDHLCRNRACVNPSHLEPVTGAENTRRAAALITRCNRGHEFSGANLRILPGGRRNCRACRVNFCRAHYAGMGIEDYLTSPGSRVLDWRHGEFIETQVAVYAPVGAR